MNYKIILQIINGFFGFIFLVIGFTNLLFMDHGWWDTIGSIVLIVNGIFIYGLIYFMAKKDASKRNKKS
jgi:hypothetical protein